MSENYEYTISDQQGKVFISFGETLNEGMENAEKKHSIKIKIKHSFQGSAVVEIENGLYGVTWKED